MIAATIKVALSEEELEARRIYRQLGLLESDVRDLDDATARGRKEDEVSSSSLSSSSSDSSESSRPLAKEARPQEGENWKFVGEDYSYNYYRQVITSEAYARSRFQSATEYQRGSQLVVEQVYKVSYQDLYRIAFLTDNKEFVLEQKGEEEEIENFTDVLEGGDI
jgi:hypothetical protein